MLVEAVVAEEEQAAAASNQHYHHHQHGRSMACANGSWGFYDDDAPDF
jgi:hypothetical protein